MKTTHNCALIILLFGVAWATSASAAISVANTVNGNFDTSSGSGTISYTPTSVGNTIVFGTYLDADYTVTSATFGGNNADGTVSNSRTTLAYFLDASGAGLVFTPTTGSANSAYVIYELSGVDSGATVDLGTGQTITTTAAGEFVVNFLGVNNGPADGATVSPFSISVVDYDGWADANSAIGGGSIAAGSGVGGVAGSQQLGWNGGWQWGEVSVAFAAVPEPSAALLGGLGMLALIRRRRA